MTTRNGMTLLLHYLLVYPLYYVLAMLIATVLISLIKDWSMSGAKAFFIVMAISMWFASYLIHYKVLFYALGDLRRGSRQN